MSKSGELAAAMEELEALVYGEPCEWTHVAEAFDRVKACFVPAAELTAGDTGLSHAEFKHTVDIAYMVVAISQGENRRDISLREALLARGVLALLAATGGEN